MWSSNSTQNRPSKTCFHKPISGLGMEKKLNLTQQKHAFTNQKKCSTAQFWVTGHWSVQLSVIEKCRTDSILTHTHTHLEHNYCILLLRIIILLLLHNVPSVLWRCWLGGRKGIRPVKNWVVGAGVVICLERGAECNSAPRSRQITTPSPHHSVFTGRMPFLQPTVSIKALKAHYVTVKVL